MIRQYWIGSPCREDWTDRDRSVPKHHCRMQNTWGWIIYLDLEVWTSKSHFASITSKPLFIRVALSIGNSFSHIPVGCPKWRLQQWAFEVLLSSVSGTVRRCSQEYLFYFTLCLLKQEIARWRCVRCQSEKPDQWLSFFCNSIFFFWFLHWLFPAKIHTSFVAKAILLPACDYFNCRLQARCNRLSPKTARS